MEELLQLVAEKMAVMMIVMLDLAQKPVALGMAIVVVVGVEQTV